MSAWSVGSRIAAVRNATDGTVFLYGRGVYAGDFPRPGSGNWSLADREDAERAIREGEEKYPIDTHVGWVRERLEQKVAAGELTREDMDAQVAESRRRYEEHRDRPMEEKVVELLQGLDLNPRLDLDGGGTVWGCECWWMPEEEFEKFAGGRTVVQLPEPARGVG